MAVEKKMLGIYVNGITNGPMYRALDSLMFSDGCTLLQEIEGVIEASRDNLLTARIMSGGYPSGDVDRTITTMNHQNRPRRKGK